MALTSPSSKHTRIWRATHLSRPKWHTIATRRITYHAPPKHYLPEKILPELFLKLPLPDLSFSELISKNYPMPFVFMWVARHYPPRTPVLVELFFEITVTRFEVFRINWVMFSWQMVHTKVGISPTIYSAQNPEKTRKVSKTSPERSLGPPDPELRKSQKKVRKVKKSLKINHLLEFSDFFGDFFGTLSGSGIGGSQTLLGRLFWDFLGFSGVWAL